VATGRTIDSALRRIEHAIELHLRGMREDGLRIPAPRQRAIRPRKSAKQVDFYATVEVAA
jgi:predicted RNase H-like HicB family nuclease